MKAGDLVKIKRASIGVPKDTVALIVRIVSREKTLESGTEYHVVRLFGVNSFGQNVLRERRYLEMDLEVISGSR